MTTKVTGNLTAVPIINKNELANGNFDIWQRGTSFTSHNTGYTADRFRVEEITSGTIDVARDTDIPTPAESGAQADYSLKLTVTGQDPTISASEQVYIETNLEGSDLGPLWGQTCVLSFWVKSSVTGTYCIAFHNGGKTRSYVVEYTVDAANTWEYKQINVTLDDATTGWTFNDTSAGIRMAWSLAVGSGYHGTPGVWTGGVNLYGTSNQVNWMNTAASTFRLSQVKFEVGQDATQFEKAPHATELNKCQRYYERLDANQSVNAFGAGFNNSTTLAYAYVPFNTPKRATPTLTVSSSANFSVESATGGLVACTNVTGRVNGYGLHGVNTQLQVAAGLTAGEGCLLRANTSAAWIAFDCDL